MPELTPDDEALIKWFPFSTQELEKLREALICSPRVGKRKQELINEIRMVLRMRAATPHE
jgi:hypothetical protein